MKAITVYDAIDGRRFKTESECARYEEFLPKFDTVMSMLPQAVDDLCKFANGGGYVQHTAESLELFRNAASNLIAEYISRDAGNKFGLNPLGVIFRELSDGYGPLADKCFQFCNRLACIDGQLREWGQQYYASHPEEATNQPWPNVKGVA